jgi:uncharacterized membrane protein
MKTSGLIKLIGILCIIFGISGLTESIAHINIIEMAESEISEFSPKVQSLVTILGYVGILVYVLYLVAGVFFLIKKTFSLNMIYIALISSILFVFIPLVIINKGDSSGYLFDYRLSLSNLLSPALDIALLIGVSIISKNYYKKPDELVESKILTLACLKFLTFLGLLCFSIPISIFGLWLYVSNLANNQFDRVTILRSYFPYFLRGRYDTAYISLAFCLLAIILSSISLKLTGYLWKTLNIFILVFGCLLMLLNLFQMM